MFPEMGVPPPRWRRALKRLFWLSTDLLFALGLARGFHRQRAGSRILVYHGFDETGSTEFNTRMLARGSIERHLAYFSAHCQVVSIAELMGGRRAADRLTVALSFDDGYANNLEIALPLLEKYRLPATFFITGALAEGTEILWADLVDLAARVVRGEMVVAGERYRRVRRGGLVSTRTGRRLLERCRHARWREIETVMADLMPLLDTPEAAALAPVWRPLGPEEIRRMAASERVEIGAHGHFHTRLGLIPHDEAVVELKRSKAALERLTGREVDAVAYPENSYTRSLVDAAERIGYRRQLAVDFLFPEDATDPRLAGRMGVNPIMSWNNQLWRILEGGY